MCHITEAECKCFNWVAHDPLWILVAKSKTTLILRFLFQLGMDENTILIMGDFSEKP